MTFIEADRRLARIELDLARLQHEEVTPSQLAANLMRESLKQTLANAALIASVATVIIDGMDGSIEQLSRDLNAE